MDEILKYLLCITGLPLAAALLIALLGPKLLRGQSHWLALAAALGSFLCSVLLLLAVRGEISKAGSPHGFEKVYNLWTWADVSDAYDQRITPPAEGSGSVTGGLHDFQIEVALRTDALSAIMLCMVTFVASLVVLFAIGYMKGDRGYWRFFSYVSLFIFSMTMLVSVSNFALLFVFWEAVGVCSYLLIGFWYEKPSAVAAGKKAFLVNRIGDFGFALAIFLIWTTFGTLNFHDSDAVQGAAATAAASPEVRGVLGATRIASDDYVVGPHGQAVLLAICLLLLLGACGKSAQFPLHVWLPDAMEGPTPVSALIHAATMVTAGVYMVTRCTPLFTASPTAQMVVACVGAGTALLAGLIALTQNDLKRVLAYSTVSQLGYMFLALGTGSMAGIVAGMFHLFTHAFFKALLFLGSGSVMHAMGNVIDMRRFGGLRKRMPITHLTFACGCLALAGVFPFAGFWSKDAIVAAVHDKAHVPAEAHLAAADTIPVHLAGYEVSGAPAEHSGSSPYASIYGWLYYVAMVTSFLTAFYTFRAFFLTFYGKERIPPEAGHHAHESPLSMTMPLVALAACAVFVGFTLDSSFADFLQQTPSLAAGAVTQTTMPGFHLDVAVISTVVALLGIGSATYFYLGDRNEIARVGKAMKMERRPGLAGLSPYQLSLNKFFLDEIYSAVIVKPLQGVARLSYWLDRYLVDGLVNVCGRIPPLAGLLMRSLQMGLVQFYALAMVLGALIMVAARMIWAAN